MRHYDDWLQQYLDFTAHLEPPRVMHFWAGVSAIAALLRRNVWLDEQPAFTWYPNLYIIFVGPPEIVKKSATVGMATRLLEGIPEIHTGPTISTWQSLISELDKIQEEVETAPGVWQTEACMYIAAGELGSFLDTEDEQLMNTLITLWDGAKIDKKTKCAGNEKIDRPCLNFIGCTTPSWFDRNMPVHIAEGGLFTRIIFVYADKRSKRVALPSLVQPKDTLEIQEKLQRDLLDMRRYKGEIVMEKDAVDWLVAWYDDLCDRQENDGASLVMARQEPMLVKLGMVLAASRNSVSARNPSRLLVTKQILIDASSYIAELSGYRQRIFSNVGRTQESRVATQMQTFIRARKSVSIVELAEKFHAQMPTRQQILNLLEGLTLAGFCEVRYSGMEQFVVLKDGKEEEK